MLIEDPNRGKVDLSELFPPGEHGIYAYYGRIGQGKTYAMTADVLEQLHRGKVVYTNYPINYKGYDQKDNLFWLFMGLFKIKRFFYKFPAENLKRIEIDEHFHDNFSKLTDCIVALDEGYVVFDSYQLAKMSMSKRKNVLHTRHFDRSIWYTTQRPSAIHVTMRAQTNVFYKVSRIVKLGKLILFRRQEFDLASDESVNETKSFGTKLYFGKKSIFEAYDTKYLRMGANPSQYVLYESFKVKWVEIIRLITQKFLRASRALRRAKLPNKIKKAGIKDKIPLNIKEEPINLPF